MKFLNFGRVVDTTRLKTEFGFTPRWTTRQAFDDYLASSGLRADWCPRARSPVSNAGSRVADERALQLSEPNVRTTAKAA